MGRKSPNTENVEKTHQHPGYTTEIEPLTIRLYKYCYRVRIPGISDNDPDALQDHCVIMYRKSQGRERGKDVHN